MQCIRNLVEYYDELHPVTESIKDFYGQFKMQYPFPQKLLHIGSGTGTLEFFLAREGYDVTGIEVFQPLLDSASLKRRTQLLSIRFFNLSTIEMGKFLGKKFYNVISCLNNRIVFIREKEMMQNFFSDCHNLLCADAAFFRQLDFFRALRPFVVVHGNHIPRRRRTAHPNLGNGKRQHHSHHSKRIDLSAFTR